MDQFRQQELIEKYLNGSATAVERAELDQWYRKSNEEEVEWNGNAKELMAYKVAGLEAIRSHMGKGKKSRYMVLKIAAAVVALAFLSLWYLTDRDKEVSFSNTEATVINKPVNRYVILPDGSMAVLGKATKISFHESDKKRELKLTGEAFFDIKHNPAKPFIIHTGDLVTTVLGTSFNIRAYPGENVTVTVKRGKVQLSSINAKPIGILTPNQQINFDTNKGIAQQQVVSTEKIISWVSADMQFDQQPLELLMQNLSKRYDISFRFLNADLKKCRITGHLSGMESIEEVLKILSATTGLSFVNNEEEDILIDGVSCSI